MSAKDRDPSQLSFIARARRLEAVIFSFFLKKLQQMNVLPSRALTNTESRKRTSRPPETPTRSCSLGNKSRPLKVPSVRQTQEQADRSKETPSDERSRSSKAPNAGETIAADVKTSTQPVKPAGFPKPRPRYSKPRPSSEPAEAPGNVFSQPFEDAAASRKESAKVSSQTREDNGDHQAAQSADQGKRSSADARMSNLAVPKPVIKQRVFPKPKPRRLSAPSKSQGIFPSPDKDPLSSAAVKRPSIGCGNGREPTAGTVNHDELGSSLYDILMPPHTFWKYPKPVELETGQCEIMDVTLKRGKLLISGTDKESTWVPGSDGSWQRFYDPNPYSGKQTDSHDSNYEFVASTWQHMDIIRDCIVGITEKKRPTPTEFSNFKKMLISSTKRSGDERDNGVFVQLMLTVDGELYEYGPATANEVFGNDSDTLISSNTSLGPRRRCHSGDHISSSMSCTHAVIARSNSKVQVWGEPRLRYPSPFQEKVTEVACGEDFVVVLAGKKVYTWGTGKLGQLGHGDTQDLQKPKKVDKFDECTTIAAGSGHVAAIASGQLYEWGVKYGQGEMSNLKTPTKTTATNYNIKKVSCGEQHTLCLATWKLEIKRIFYPLSTGDGTRGQLGHGNTDRLDSLKCIKINSFDTVNDSVKDVSAGRKHSAILTNNGDVYTFGCNRFGQLGYFTKEDYSSTPEKVCLGKEVTAEEVSCSEDCTMVLTTQKEVLMWGKGFYGTKVQASLPAHLEADGHAVISIAACRIQDVKEQIELAFALKKTHSVVLFRVGRSSVNFQAMEVNVPCNVDDLTSMQSTGSILLATNTAGKLFYADCRSWCNEVLASEDESGPSDERRDSTLMSAFCRRESENTPMPKFEWKECGDVQPDKVVVISATSDTFFILTEAGDVYSWNPFHGNCIIRHTELDDRIVKEIACGMEHAVARTDEGRVLTYGRGSAGQLGHGTFQDHFKFKSVQPADDSMKAEKICCGPTSTAVLSQSGKVYFWGQPDVPEKQRSLMLSNLGTPISSEPVLYSAACPGEAPKISAFQVLLDDKASQKVALVGIPFTMTIIRKQSDDRDISGASSPQVFRVEACSRGHETAPVFRKGKVEKVDEEKFEASILFSTKGEYEVSTTVDGAQVDTFCVRVEEPFISQRRKLALLGKNYNSVRIVAEGLEKEEHFEDVGLKVQLWGLHAATSTNQQLCDAAALASMNDAGTYLYVWDYHDGSLAEDNLMFWLSHLNERAPSAEVVFLGLNRDSSAKKKHDQELQALLDFKTNLRHTVLMEMLRSESMQADFVQAIQSILQSRHVKEVVWSKIEDLAKEIERVKKNPETKALTKAEFERLARSFEIEGNHQIDKAARYLDETGLGLKTDLDEAFLVLNESWFNRVLTDISYITGTPKTRDLGGEERLVADVLIKKKLAFKNSEGTKLYIVPLLKSRTGESPTERKEFIACRHLVMPKKPHVLHTTFSRLVSGALKEHPDARIYENTLVIQTGTSNCRVDCGPSLMNRTHSEIRVVVRAESPDKCGEVADAVAASLRSWDGPSNNWSIKVCCRWCHGYYIELTDKEQGDTEQKCLECERSLVLHELRHGYKDNERRKDFVQWPDRTPTEQVAARSHGDVQSCLIACIDKKLNDQLSELKEQFSKVARLFVKEKEVTVPRAVCILPENIFRIRECKWRLRFVCEGDGDGKGMHITDHDGYPLVKFSETVCKCACIFKNVLVGIGILLRQLNPLAGDATKLVPPAPAILAILGGAAKIGGVSLTTTDWPKHFATVEKFIAGLQQDSARGSPLQSGEHPDVLEAYTDQNLKILLNDLNVRPGEYGGLVRIYNEEDGYAWVCKQHRRKNYRDSPVSEPAPEGSPN